MLAKEYVNWDAGKKAYVPDHAVRQHALDWLHEEGTLPIHLGMP